MNTAERWVARKRVLGFAMTIPMAVVFYALGYYFRSSLPELFLVAIAIIPTLATIFLCTMGWKYIKDLRGGTVKLETGIVTSKVLFMSHNTTIKTNKASSKTKSQYIILNNVRYDLSNRHFNRILEGKQAQLALGIYSGGVLSVSSNLTVQMSQNP